MRLSVALLAALAISGCATTKSSTTSTTKDSSYSGHGAGSVSPEVVAKFAPPPLEPALARRIQMMLDVRSPGMGMPTSDGKKLFFGWSVSGTPQIWRIDSPKAFPVQMTGGNDKTSVVGITADNRWLIVSRDRAGEENPGLYLQDVDGGALKEIIHKPGVRTSLNQISEDGRTIYYSANDQKPDSMAIYAYDLASGNRTALWSEPGLWQLADIRKDGLMLLAKFTGSMSSEWSTFDPKTKKLQPVIGQGESEEYEVGFGPTDEFLVLTNRMGDFRRLYRFGKSGLKPLTADRKMDVESFSIDNDRKHILISWNDQGYSRLEAFDAKTFKPIELPQIIKGANAYAGGTTLNSRFTTIGIETEKAPRTSYVYDWQTKKLTQWVVSSSPEVKTSTFADVRLEYYPARDGTKIPMLVRRPQNCQAPCPVDRRRS